jgi:hypothetical protein
MDSFIDTNNGGLAVTEDVCLFVGNSKILRVMLLMHAILVGGGGQDLNASDSPGCILAVVMQSERET